MPKQLFILTRKTTLQDLKLGKVKFGIPKIGCSMSSTRYYLCCIQFLLKLTIWWNISGPKYNKEQYLQANCQFVVKSSGDYSVHLADPDTIVNWDLIEQVVLKTTASVPSCPICLYPPKAAKVAKCGHVFCWPCILHYLALSDHSWRKCKLLALLHIKADYPPKHNLIRKKKINATIFQPWRC